MSGKVGPYTMVYNRVGSDTTWGVEDINRIGGALAYIQQQAAVYGMTFEYTPKSDYQVNDWLNLTLWLENTWNPLIEICDKMDVQRPEELGAWSPKRGMDVMTANLMELYTFQAWEAFIGTIHYYPNATYTGPYMIG